MGDNKQVTPHYKRVKDICLDIYSRDEQVEKRLLSGRALLNTEKGEFMFAQNEPRGPRSVEVGRTVHSRFVRRPDGLYTVTFSSMDSDEKHLKEQLIAEVREICAMIKEDKEARKRNVEKGGKK